MPGFPLPLPILPPPEPGEAWGCLDLPGPPDVRIEARGPFASSALPPADGLAFYTNDFALSDPAPWKIPARSGTAARCPAAPSDPADQTDPPDPANQPDPPIPATSWTPPDRREFRAVFDEAMRAINGRQLLKVVPACTASARLSGNPAAALHSLLDPARSNGRGHAAAWSDGVNGFATITPEVLFRLDGARLTTMALAGTADAAHEADLRKGPKLAREHEIVVDELHRRLATLGRVTMTDREVVTLGTVRHLRTSLSVNLSSAPGGSALNDLIRLLHPTPALGISPRSETTLAQLQDYRKRCGVPAAFGAPCGVAWPGGALFLVAIRGLFWTEKEIRLPVGGGLVAGSVFETEWEELELKRAWVRSAFELDAVHA
ncbi:MAG: chorismate-binding protein [Verrucomicrobiota bacterium]